MRASAVAVQFTELARALVSRGHEVTFVTPGHTPPTLEGVGAAIVCWPSKRPTRLADGRLAFGLMRRLNPTCVIASFASINWLMVTSWTARVPMRVAWYHTLSSAINLDCAASSKRTRFLKRAKSSLLYGLTTHVVAVSEAGRRDVIQACGVKPSKCHVLLNAIADPGLYEQEVPQAKIVCAGRLDPCKGQDVLIRAFARVAERFPDVQLELLGSGRLEADCRALATSLGIGARCSLPGEVPRSMALQEMARARICVVPSRSEAFGMAVVEAMAVGAPIIATNVGGIPEVVRNGQDGVLVPPDDPLALAATLERLLAAPVLRTELGRRARTRFLNDFEVGGVVKRQADWLEKELAKPAIAPSLSLPGGVETVKRPCQGVN